MRNPLNSSKRQDLQGIRGIAIISVLFFHFLPNTFPNGYIGVDQFFVLSGFLMCMLLRKSSSCSSLFQFISNFYIRRLKRILPLYFLIILLAITAVLTVFPLTAIDKNVESGKKALVFLSNRAETDSESYFKKLSMATDVFTHTWSLSVEVQFCLIIPFLYLIGAKVPSPKFETHFYVFLGMIAYIISDTSESTHSSNNVYQKIENSPEDESHSSTSYYPHFLTSIIIFGSFFPLEIPNAILRPLITVLTGALMVFPSSFLESKVWVYFGDISHSLYLIHWPIYAYWKLNNHEGDTWNSRLIVAFQASIFLAILSYECYEKFMNIGDPLNITRIDDDPIYKTMKGQAEKLSKLVKNKIFLMQQVPRLKIEMLAGMVEAVKGKKDLAEFDKSLIDIDPKMARLRYEKLEAECPKCELFDYEPYFFNKTTKTWRFYDEKMNGLTYITQGLHLSFHGLELIRPVVKSVCAKMDGK
ncbi:CBN-OAC-38 protein [Caenorhabditis brenneri]|uniref:CBN-OAC-38 protein n=1 Tax=Caenorhabditis brenneri TaxID=135651 RepID=G0NE83_CAEBE|nr:CBN-OAC-38 protein [Caenorhabditis brenneri]